MKKNLILPLLLLLIVACKNNSHNEVFQDTDETTYESYIMTEVELKISEETRRVDNNFNKLIAVHTHITELENKIAGLNKSSKEYINTEQELKLNKAEQQEILDRINKKYAAKYLGCLLLDSHDNEMFDIASDKIKASIRKEMLIEYRDNLLY
ncbi:MAG: hypothetical protein AUK64_2498 [bacterium P201]|nr:MAG: hypothetical protein AUK64_2498 [bacterium P201]